LGGLPVTVKSAIDVAGLRCETGSPSRKGRAAVVLLVALSQDGLPAGVQIAGRRFDDELVLRVAEIL
jgi:Asp-tRNA(Asn)/Glu-tRNA(Gln) amidotransferase A subunit family amidase